MVLRTDVNEDEEMQMVKILLSIIILYGERGLPLEKVDEEFQYQCGFSIPYRKFGAETLRSWILTLPDIYLIRDHCNKEVLIQHSLKSNHLKELISKQKSRRSQGNNYFSNRKQNADRRFTAKNGIPNGCFLHNSINNKLINQFERYDIFKKLESMLPLLYKHQALGDDFFLDIVDTKLGYYVPENGPKECGLCVAGQTISDLTEKVKRAEHLAPRVVVMIGFVDLLLGRNITDMLYDLKQLITELKKKNTRVTLITLIPSPKLPRNHALESRMEIFNKAILDYAYGYELRCNIIDMNKIFYAEMNKFQREICRDRFMKVAKKDNYKVFSDYGRKVFLNTLKSCLKEQIESGH